MRLGRSIVCLFLLGCDPFPVLGNGDKTTRELSFEDFDGVENSGELDVHVLRGGDFAVQVTIDDNLHRYVDIWVDAGTLRIDTTRSLDFRGTGRINIVMPRLLDGTLSGSGNLEIEGVGPIEDTEISLLGSGNIDVCGSLRSLTAEVSGSGSLRACAGSDRSLELLVLSSSGSGDFVWDGPVDTFEIEGRGSGDFRLSGRGRALVVGIRGSGSLDAVGFSVTQAELRTSGSGGIRAFVEERATVRISGSGDVNLWGPAELELESDTGSGSVIRH